MIIAAVLIIAVSAFLVYYFVLLKPEVPEEAQLTQEERARLILTEEEIEQGYTIERKIAELEEERRLALEEGQEITPVEVEEAAVKPIVAQETISSTLSPDQKSLIYFDPEEEDFVISDLDGNNPRSVTSLDLKNVWDVNWSQSRDSAIVTTSDNEGRDKQYTYVNLRDQSTFTYDSKFQSVNLNPKGNKIAYLYRDEENDISNISVANTDTSSFTTLYSYPEPDVEINWFDENYIEFNNKSSGFKEGEISITDSAGATLRVIVGERYGVDPLYSLDNNKILYSAASVKSPRKLKLYVTDKQGMNEGAYLGIDTLIDKCTWSLDNVTVYCGVPDFYTDSLVMPNDYYNERFISTDSLYEINTDTRRAKVIKASKDLEETYDIHKPFMSADGSLFYFTNRIDGQLNAITIPKAEE